MQVTRSPHEDLPGAGLDASKMPGHWLLARLGKRVLRPGGREMTDWILRNLYLGPEHDVVELAPGLGATMRTILKAGVRTYTGIERDPAAVAILNRDLSAPHEVRVGTADATGLPDAGASIVVGEAMLSMQSGEAKIRIVEEAHRILRPGGVYAIHELAFIPDGAEQSVEANVEGALREAIRVGARPISVHAWRRLLQDAGFRIVAELRSPMHLLELPRLLADEGLAGTTKFLRNVARDPVARARVLEMRRAFRRYKNNLCAVAFIAVKETNG